MKIRRTLKIVISFLVVLFSYEQALPQQREVPVIGRESPIAKHVQDAEASVVSIHTLVSCGGKELWRVGSGFVYDSNGFIVTRSSVVQSADTIIVTFSNGRIVPAEVFHYDEKLQVALLKVPTENLSPMKRGKSSNLTSKSMLTIIGNSLGVFPSVTFGTYQGRRRDGMLMLNVIVPPGNCGSPVLDREGRVVGILIGRIVKAHSNEIDRETSGIALPVESVQYVIDDVLTNFVRGGGWVGLSVVGLQDEYYRRGVIVKRIVSGGPACMAGICVGDTIIGFEGRSIMDARELAKWVRGSLPDKKVVFTLQKGRMEITRLVRIGDWP
jgi:serine protease Do